MRHVSDNDFERKQGQQHFCFHMVCLSKKTGFFRPVLLKKHKTNAVHGGGKKDILTVEHAMMILLSDVRRRQILFLEQ